MIPCNKIIDKGVQKILFYGVAFKAGTDDTRASPFLKLAELLLANNCTVELFDSSLQKLIGSLDTIAPHTNVNASHLTSDLESSVNTADLILICHKPHNKGDLQTIAENCAGKLVIDLVRIKDSNINDKATYDGIAW